MNCVFLEFVGMLVDDYANCSMSLLVILCMLCVCDNRVYIPIIPFNYLFHLLDELVV